MGIVVGAVVVVAILQVGIYVTPVVVAVASVEAQIHHLQQLMYDAQAVVKVKVNAAQRRGNQQNTVLQPAHHTTQVQIAVI
jgi:sulfur relay (sulfurtransferase) complex TusBCD TusD component (DsrE family)